MKTVTFYAAMLLLVIAIFTACEKDNMKEEEEEPVAGKWYVKFQVQSDITDKMYFEYTNPADITKMITKELSGTNISVVDSFSTTIKRVDCCVYGKTTLGKKLYLLSIKNTVLETTYIHIVGADGNYRECTVMGIR